MTDGSRVTDKDSKASEEEQINSSHEKSSKWELWPFFLLHLSSGLSGTSCPSQLGKLALFFFFLIVVMPFPPNSPTLSGSLTTLLIAHLATLELGDHLESYVALTGLLRLHSRHFFIKLTFLVSTHFSSGQHAHYKYSFISNTGGRPPAGVCHPGRVLAAVVRSAQASPGLRCPSGPHMGRDCC